MTRVCRDLLGLPDKLGNKKDQRRPRSREETRVTKDLQDLPVILDTPDPLARLEDRKERRENLEKPEKEANQEKTVIPVLQASPESKESRVFRVHQAETEKED